MTHPSREHTYLPDPRDDNDPLAPPPELRQAAFESIHESFTRRRHALAQMRDKINHQLEIQASLPPRDHVKFERMDDEFLLMFLRIKKMRVEKAFPEYLNFCRAQQKNPWLEEIDMSIVEQLFSTKSFQILPNYDPIGRLILSMDFNALVPLLEKLGKNNSHKLMSALFGMIETIMGDIRAQIFGVVIISDLTGCKTRTFRYLSASQYILSLDLCQNCYPIRASGMYLIHEPWYVKGLFNMMRPFMKQKVKDNLVCFGSDVAGVQKYVPKDSLLPTYGGLLKLDEVSLTREWVKKVRQTLSARRGNT